MPKNNKNVNLLVEREVAKLLLKNPDITAPEIKKKAEKAFKLQGFNLKFTDRTYLNIKKRLSPNILENPIDELWTIGACPAAGISPEYIPRLIDYQRVSDRPLSIRKALWMVRLLPIFQELIKKLTENAQLQYGYWSRIADFYAEREQLSEIVNRPVNTADLDDFIFKTNHTSLKSLDSALLAWVKMYQTVKNDLEKDGE